jgi:hypothetical protein|tara:strand:+ start:2647 stop:3438 length:792 start_codon:yes stop_codon:yes gene_type:complete
MLIDVNLGKNAEYTLTYELFDNRVAKKVWQRLKNHKFPVLNNSSCYGFGESIQEVEQVLYNTIDELKNLKPDLEISSMDLNYLHDIFASMHYNLMEEKYPSQKLYDILVKLNDTIHHLEDLNRSNKAKILVLTDDPGEELIDEDYDLFTPDMTEHWLYMGYPHVGKHIMAIFNDGDIDIPKEQIQPTHLLKTFLLCWLDKDLVAGRKYMLNLNRFLAKIHNKLPYPIDDKKLAVGKIPLGKLTHEPDLSEIKKNRFIHSIKAY